MPFPFRMFITYPIFHAMERVVFTSRPFEKTWSAVRPKLEQGVDLIALSIHPKGPVFLRKYLYQEPTLRQVIGQCMREMFNTEVMALLSQIRHIRRDIARQEEKILEWEKDLVAAPRKSWNPLDFSQSKLKSKINAAQSRITMDKAKIDSLINKSLYALHARGIMITKEQIESLLNTAEGEDIASIMAVADTVKLIFSRLESQLSENVPTADLCKTYSGFYMMCNRIYLEAIDKALYQIDKKYLKKIAKIRQSVEAQIGRANVHLKKFSTAPAHKETLKTNIAINETTLAAADFYSKYLMQRSKELLELREKAKLNYEVSLNTFLTMKMGAELVDVMQKSQKDLAQVFDFEPPALSSDYAKGFSDQFKALTAQLKN